MTESATPDSHCKRALSTPRTALIAYPGSRIPPEIAHEITAHNAHDTPTLRAMCLVSRATRSLAIIHLFSSVQFVRIEDIAWWLEMLERTPTLATAVTRVKFSPTVSPPHVHSRMSTGFSLGTTFHHWPDSPIPSMPPFPNVRSVEYDGLARDIRREVLIDTARTSLFPRIEELRLANFGLDSFADLAGVSGRCGRLKCLSFDNVFMVKEELERLPGLTNPDLTALEQVVVRGCSPGQFIGQLLTGNSLPSLRTLAFNHCDEEQACSVEITEQLLQLCAPSLVNLVIDPFFGEIDEADNSAMFGRLPLFPALESLTVWLNHTRRAENAIRVLQGAPNLTQLIFRLDLPYHYYDDLRDDFGELLEDIFPWNTSESIKATITRKFPSCRRIGFHFCIPKDSQMHYRRGMRRRMERLLKQRMEDIGAEIEEYLHVEWLDESFQPVHYQRTNGKPTWRATWFRHDYSEPETESSDCEEPKEPEVIHSEDWYPEFYPPFAFDD